MSEDSPGTGGSRGSSDSTGRREPTGGRNRTGSSDPESASGRSPAAHADARPAAATVLALTLVSFLCAGFIVASGGAVAAAVGAAALGLAFASIAGSAALGGPALPGLLADAWAEHRAHVWFAAGLFGLSALVGIAMFAAGIDLLELVSELFEETLEEEEFGADSPAGVTATFFVVNNSMPFLVAIVGALTLGLVTAAIMVFNGVIVGNIAVSMGASVGFGPILALLVPHGVFELPALFVAAGVGFRLLHRGVQRVIGARDALFTRSYLVRTAALVAVAWLVLVLAAFVEAYVTVVIAEFLYPDLGG